MMSYFYETFLDTVGLTLEVSDTLLEGFQFSWWGYFSNISLSQPTEDSFAFVTILSKLHDLQSFLQDLKPCLDVACVCMHAQSFSRVRLFATLWTVARQPPLSIGFSRQEYWSGLSWPSSGDLPYPGIEQASPASPASTGEFFHH